MKCEKCGHEATRLEFPYRYRMRLDSPQVMRECPKCRALIVSDDFADEKQEESHYAGA